MGSWRCLAHWHDWQQVTDWRFPLPPIVWDGPLIRLVKLERCTRCGKERGRESTPSGPIDADVDFVKFVMSCYEDTSDL